MCGIVGIADLKKSGKHTDKFLVRKMLDSISWRGPDADGIWENDHVTLGHVRLSIIDLSSSANQPMTDWLGNTIVFNGEIYNYQTLRNDLASSFEFKTRSDTEVILAAYSKWGSDCVNYFNGEWAFAIYDKANKSLFLSRDRFGIKPLYYCIVGNTLYFASEIRALLAAGIPAVTSIAKIAKFLRFRQIEQHYETILKDIFPLEPGNNLVIDLYSGQFREYIYYGQNELFSASIPQNEGVAAEAFGELLLNAVRIRLHADVPVQVLLSGGLDSSAIAALAGMDGKDVQTISYVCPNHPSDESYYSDIVASYLGTHHHRVELKVNNFFDIFNQIINAQDHPTHSEKHVARYLLYRFASQNAKVVIEGQGGDEVFGGYGTIYNIFREEYQDKLGVKLLMKTDNKTVNSSLPHLAEFHPSVRNKIGKISKDIDSIKTHDRYKKRQYSILRNNLLSLLHTGDRLQMFNSIEGRYPFLDHRIVEFGMSSPVKFKMREFDKYLLRVFLDENKLLPREVVRRTDKKGFSTNMHDFIFKSLKVKKGFRETFVDGVKMFPELFDISSLDHLLHEQYDACIDNTNRLLAMYSLIIYMKNNRVEVSE
jgi:asparagine synthase (glutamine-hydrolysing)